MAGSKVTSLVDVFEASVRDFAPRKLFGTKRDGQYQWITYGEFGKLVTHFRGGLATLGVTHGDRVAIISNNSVEWAVAAYATYSLGACFVPMYEKQHIDDWIYIINDSGAKILVVANTGIANITRPLIKKLDSLETIINLGGAASEENSYASLLKLGEKKPAEIVRPDTKDLAGFIYTSGTTGKPKGVLLAHSNFAHNVNALEDCLEFRPEDSSLSFLPWAHSFGQTCELHCMFANGGAIGLAENVTTIIPNLAEVKPTLLFSVPRIFNKIYDGVNKKMEKEGGLKLKLFQAAMNNANHRRALAAEGKTSWWAEKKHKFFDKLIFSKVRERFGGRLRYAFSGGAALSKDVAIFVDNLGITVYEGYGLSETSPVACANMPGAHRIGSVGKPISGVKIVIEPVAHIKEEGIGEIIIYGDNVMQGYHGLPEANKAAFTDDGGFRSGDLGHVDKDGFVFITGRVKEQYKLENGKYVVPAPLEEQLKLSPFINQVMIYGANKPHNVALIVPDEESLMEWAKEQGLTQSFKELLDNDKVRAHMHGQLAEYGRHFKGYEHPRKFKLIGEEFSTDNDMLTPKMSLKRHNVMKVYGELIQSLYA